MVYAEVKDEPALNWWLNEINISVSLNHSAINRKVRILNNYSFLECWKKLLI